MESYESYAQEESPRKRALDDGQNDDKPAKRFNSGNEPLLKLLVPNYVAGKLIGKGGALITELKSKFGGNLRLSANKEFYPGSQERVVVITGEISEIIDINNHIMEVMQAESAKHDNPRDKQVKIVLTGFVAGLLIGKGGETVKAINSQTKAKLSIAARAEGTVPGERLLTMSGTIDQRTDACKMVVEKIATDESNQRNTNLKYADTASGISASFGNNSNFTASTQNLTPYGSSKQFSLPSQNTRNYEGNQFSVMSVANNNQYSKQSQNSSYGNNNNILPNPTQNAMSYGNTDSYRSPTQSASGKLKTTYQIQIEVPDDLVTSVMGKGGQHIKEMVRASGGARLRFSDKNDFVAGTKNRMLTISGSADQAKAAHTLLKQKVDTIASQSQYGMF